MADRSRQPAVLLRKIARLEALLEEAHADRKLHFERTRDLIFRAVDAEQRLKQVQDAINERYDDE